MTPVVGEFDIFTTLKRNAFSEKYGFTCKSNETLISMSSLEQQ